jgi:hypothetical protein
VIPCQLCRTELWRNLERPSICWLCKATMQEALLLYSACVPPLHVASLLDPMRTRHAGGTMMRGVRWTRMR